LLMSFLVMRLALLVVSGPLGLALLVVGGLLRLALIVAGGVLRLGSHVGWVRCASRGCGGWLLRRAAMDGGSVVKRLNKRKMWGESSQGAMRLWADGRLGWGIGRQW